MIWETNLSIIVIAHTDDIAIPLRCILVPYWQCIRVVYGNEVRLMVYAHY